MKNSPVSLAVAVVLTVLTCGTALAQPEMPFYNNNYPNPTGVTATSLDLSFSGNLTNSFSDATFYYNFPWPAGGGINGPIPYSTPGLTVTDTYNAGTNTTSLVFSGTAGVPSGDVGHIGYGMCPLGTIEGRESPAFLGAAWDISSGTQQETLLPLMPALTQTLSGAGTVTGSGNTTYVLLFANVALSGSGPPAGQWAEFPVPTNAMGTPYFENDAGVPLILSNVGYQISPTLIPLEQLNPTDEPPSSFTPIPGADGVLQVGQSFTSPEPGTLALLGAAAVGLALYRRRRGG